jgi:2-polyprenyl-3-methyl-5-hydroxy-6-metoxy-1,4-benzoquinol methylase
MSGRSSDRHWERFGKIDPYFGVLSDDKFRRSVLTDEAKSEFFRSGQVYLDEVLRKVREHLDPTFAPRCALDFGCGVGRLVIPLSNIAQKVVGLDVSPSMLDEARSNCEARSIRNVEFCNSRDDLAQLEGKFDFIHSFIVFQHIPVRRGELIFDRLLMRLNAGGVSVTHFTFGKTTPFRRLLPWIKRIPLAANLANLLRGKEFLYPHMQMNSYDLNRLFRLVHNHKVRNVYTEFTDHGGELGVLLYLRKSPA